MAEEYKPFGRETYSEVHDNPKGLLRRISDSKIGNFGRSTINACSLTIIGPHTIPTLIRKVIECEIPKNMNPPIEAQMGMLLGSSLGASVELTFYLDNPKFLILPLATNLASGIYELARQKLIKQRNYNQAVQKQKESLMNQDLSDYY